MARRRLSQWEIDQQLGVLEKMKAGKDRSPPPYPVEVPKPEAPKQEPVAPRVAEIAIATPAIEKVAIADSQDLLWQNIISGEKWTGVPHDLVDEVLRTLKPTDQACLVQLYRLAWGVVDNRRRGGRVRVSHAKLAERAGISKRQAQVSTLRLEARKLIRRVDNGEREAAEYQILIPPAVGKAGKNAIAEFATSKELKEKALIKEGVAPPKCEKCNGTGWWYPEGIGKGDVKKCNHEGK